MLASVLRPQSLHHSDTAPLRSSVGLAAGMGIGWISPRLLDRGKEVADAGCVTEFSLAQVSLDVDRQIQAIREGGDRLPRAPERAGVDGGDRVTAEYVSHAMGIFLPPR
jgi:hypothetical protein